MKSRASALISNGSSIRKLYPGNFSFFEPRSKSSVYIGLISSFLRYKKIGSSVRAVVSRRNSCYVRACKLLPAPIDTSSSENAIGEIPILLFKYFWISLLTLTQGQFFFNLKKYMPIWDRIEKQDWNESIWNKNMSRYSEKNQCDLKVKWEQNKTRIKSILTKKRYEKTR